MFCNGYQANRPLLLSLIHTGYYIYLWSYTKLNLIHDYHLYYYYYNYYFTSALADGLLQEFEWQQVSRTLLSILVNLNNAVV